MLPEKTYILRLTHRGSSEIEEQEYTRVGDAWQAIELFDRPDSADMYSCIALFEYNWKTHTEMVMAAVELGA